MSKGYLIAYNSISLIAWTFILINGINEFGNISTYYSYIPHKLLFFTQLVNSSLEIAHILLGLIKAPLSTTILQCIARSIITIGVTFFFPSSPGNFITAFSYLTLAWSITEIIRYGFYLIKSITTPPYIVVYLRYTLFIVLYPIGLISEPQVVYTSILYSNSTLAKFFYSLALMAYIPGFLVLYSYMFKQRKRVLA